MGVYSTVICSWCLIGGVDCHVCRFGFVGEVIGSKSALCHNRCFARSRQSVFCPPFVWDLCSFVIYLACWWIRCAIPVLLVVNASPLGDWNEFQIRLQNDELLVDSGFLLVLLVELMPG